MKNDLKRIQLEMSKDNNKDEELEKFIQDRVDEVSEKLKVPSYKVLLASILHGLNRYRLPLQKYLSELKVEEQPVTLKRRLRNLVKSKRRKRLRLHRYKAYMVH